MSAEIASGGMLSFPEVKRTAWRFGLHRSSFEVMRAAQVGLMIYYINDCCSKLQYSYLNT